MFIPTIKSQPRRGYHYTFFGNAFFINEQGYLLTVAHVLETFRDGGQPYILVNRHNAPPRLAESHGDRQRFAARCSHSSRYAKSFRGQIQCQHSFRLASEPAVRGESVLALSLHPKRLQYAQSFDSEREDSSPGTVLTYESTQLEKSGPAADVFLLSHPVVKGQSGSPVLARNSHAVVGLVEGLWLRGVSLSSGSSQPRCRPTLQEPLIPIRYRH